MTLFTHAEGVINQQTVAASSITAVLSNAISTNDLLIAIVAAYNGPELPLSKLSDTLGNTWYRAGTNNYRAIFYCPGSKASGSGLTFTYNPGGVAESPLFVCLDRYSIGGGSAVFAGYSDAAPGGSSGNCGVLSGVPAGYLLHAGMQTDTTNLTFTAGTSNGVAATIGNQAGNAGGSGHSQYILSVLAGDQSMTWSANGSTALGRAMQVDFYILPYPDILPLVVYASRTGS